MAELSILPGVLDLTLYRGDDSTFEITLEQGGSPLPLPQDGWLAQIREKYNAAEVVAQFTVDATQAGDGVILLAAPDTATLPKKKYVWDLQLLDGGVTHTYVGGVLNLTGQVTIP